MVLIHEIPPCRYAHQILPWHLAEIVMTKSKGVGRGGRRKGAGRPRFTETGKSSYFSTRLTQKTRDLLEAEARRREKSLSEVAEDLLQLGLEEMADLNRPK